MAKANKSYGYDGAFPTILRKLMDESRRMGQPITQEMVAEKTGVTRQTVGFWCSGSTVPDAISITKIADLFNVTTDYLLGRSDIEAENSSAESASRYTGLSQGACLILHEISTCIKNIHSLDDFYKYSNKETNEVTIDDVCMEAGEAYQYASAGEDFFKFASWLLTAGSFVDIARSIKDYQANLKTATAYMQMALKLKKKQKEEFSEETGRELGQAHRSADSAFRNARLCVLDIQEAIKDDIAGGYAFDEVQAYKKAVKDYDGVKFGGVTHGKDE